MLFFITIMITRDIHLKQMSQGNVPWQNSINIKGTEFEYRAYKLEDGTVNVGTYFPR